MVSTLLNRTEQNSYFSLSEKKYTGRGLSAYGLRKNFLAPSQTKATTFKSAASRDGIIDQLRGCVYSFNENVFGKWYSRGEPDVS